MAASTGGQYVYQYLQGATSFRLLELLPGKHDEPISCHVFEADWSAPIEYEALSYSWGDPNDRVPVFCDGKKIEVTVNLYVALTHFRHPDRARILWIDALCIDQSDIPERSQQVKQMRKLYERATCVLIWVGPDVEEEPVAAIATQAILSISELLCKALGIVPSTARETGDVFQRLMLRNLDKLPRPEECDFSDTTWKSLVWFFSHNYFTRVWVVQEISAHTRRLVHCDHQHVDWDRVDMVASYILAESAFSQKYGFDKTNIWWVASISEIALLPKDWLSMFYLISMYKCLDPRDVIYGLRGLMSFSRGEELLLPDYSKSVQEVYRDSVEAAFINFQNADVLLYLTGTEDPSWIPRWDVDMCFRNPFRFGRKVPWKPAGEAKPDWSIDTTRNILSLRGIAVDSVKSAESYNQRFFSNECMRSTEGLQELQQAWHRILKVLSSDSSQLPLEPSVLIAAAVSLSFGLDEKTDIADEHESELLYKLVAHLRIALDHATFDKNIPSTLAEESKGTDGHLFGKPVWDFQYPTSSIFSTATKLIGCATCETAPGDLVFAPLGSTYPLILRSEQDHYVIKGYSYVHGIMNGERRSSDTRAVEIH